MTVAFTLLGLLLSLFVLAVALGKLFSIKTTANPKDCDHLYWPRADSNGKLIGRRCSLCKHFNPSNERGEIDYEDC
jgi:hypothetical protein